MSSPSRSIAITDGKVLPGSQNSIIDMYYSLMLDTTLDEYGVQNR